jgi:hypothetical protein
MATITESIPLQGFGLVTNRIAEILTEEIANQVEIQGFEENVEVFLERIEPFSKEEDVAITVAFKENDFEGYTQKSSSGNSMYFVDLFCSGYGQDDTLPSIVSKTKLYRYLSLIRYILSSGKMPTLLFERGLISTKYIKKIMVDTDYSNFGNHSNYDASYIRFARVIFMVGVYENQQLWEAESLLGNNSKINYENTSKGVKLIFNN